MFRVRNPQDFGAAIVFVLIGAAGLYFANDLAYGTAARMGPGYFPTLLSALIAIIGVVVGFKALAIAGPSIEPIPLRPVGIIIGCIVGFGYLIEQVGVAIAATALIVVASYARRGVNLKESMLLAVGMSIFVVAVFVYALGQPLQVFWSR
jgi:hypothetical protein